MQVETRDSELVVREQLAYASRMLASRRPAEALAALDGLEPEARTPDARLVEAAARLERGDPGGAAAAASAGLVLAPASRNLLRVLARAELELGRPVEAERALLAALASSPDDAAVLADYALVLASTGAREWAVETFGRAAAVAPEDPAVRVARERLAERGYLPEDAGTIEGRHVGVAEEPPELRAGAGTPSHPAPEADKTAELASRGPSAPTTGHEPPAPEPVVAEARDEDALAPMPAEPAAPTPAEPEPIPGPGELVEEPDARGAANAPAQPVVPPAEQAVELPDGAGAAETQVEAAAVHEDEPLPSRPADPADSAGPDPLLEPGRPAALRVGRVRARRRAPSHRALLPLWPVRRFGQAPLWVAGFCLAGAGGLLGMPWAVVLPGGWLAYASYVAIAPPLVGRLARRHALR